MGASYSSCSATNKNIPNAQTLFEEGNECVKASKFNDAIEKYNQAIELSPKPSYFSKRATAYCYLKQYDLAIQDCRFALEIDGKRSKGSNSTSATNKNIQTTRTLNEEGNECVKASKFNDAIEKYNQAIELSRKPSYFRNRAAVLQQYNLAIQDCRSALEIDDKCAKGSTSSSATNNNIQNAQTLFEEGNECVKASKFNDAIEKYNQAIELYRKPSYFCNRAAAYCSLKQYDLAIQDCRSALEIDDKCAKAYGQMGFAYYYKNHMGASLEAHETAAALDPVYMFDDEYKNHLAVQRFNEAKTVYSACRSALGSRKRIYPKDLDSFFNFLNNDVKVTREYMVPSKKAKYVEKFFEADDEPEDIGDESEADDESESDDELESDEADEEWEAHDELEEEEETIQPV